MHKLAILCVLYYVSHNHRIVLLSDVTFAFEQPKDPHFWFFQKTLDINLDHAPEIIWFYYKQKAAPHALPAM